MADYEGPCSPGPAAGDFGRPAPRLRDLVQGLMKACSREISCHSPMEEFQAALEPMASQGVVALFLGTGDAIIAGALCRLDCG